MKFFNFKNRNILKVIIAMALISIFISVPVLATPVEEVEVYTTYSFADFTDLPQVNLIHSNGYVQTFMGTSADGWLNGVDWWNDQNYYLGQYFVVTPGQPIGGGPFKSFTISSGGTLSSKGSWFLRKGSYASIPFNISIDSGSQSSPDFGIHMSDVQPTLLLYTDLNRDHWINCPLSTFDEGFIATPQFYPQYNATGTFHFTVPEDLTIFGFYLQIKCNLYSTSDYPLGALSFKLYDFNTVYKGPNYIVQVSPPPSVDQALFEEYEASLLEDSRKLLSSHKPDFNLNLSNNPKLASSMLGFSYLIENLYNISFIRVLFYFSVGLGGVGFLIGLAQHAVSSLGSYSSKSARTSKAASRSKKGG